MNNEITITRDDAREILRLLNAVSLEGLKAATLEAARELIKGKLENGNAATIHK